MTRNESINCIYNFLDQIGIEHEETQIHESTFLPGILINAGKLIIDQEKMLYPGDLLHEAGHIAVTKANERYILEGDIAKQNPQKSGEEMAVLIWSYLAAREIGLPLDILFHNDGYKGGAEWLRENYTNKKYIGLPLLIYMNIAQLDQNGEPVVVRWLRES